MTLPSHVPHNWSDKQQDKGHCLRQQQNRVTLPCPRMTLSEDDKIRLQTHQPHSMQAWHSANLWPMRTFTFLRPSFRSMGCGLNFLTVGVKRGTGSIGSSMRSPAHHAHMCSVPACVCCNLCGNHRAPATMDNGKMQTGDAVWQEQSGKSRSRWRSAKTSTSKRLCADEWSLGGHPVRKVC